MTVELGHGIRLLSGAMFDYNTPDQSDVTIEDIASALSKICRFAGHIHQFYSVAQHAVNVSRIVPPSLALTGLLHDTAEAFTNDLPTPLKHAVPAFKNLEIAIETTMSRRFGFLYPLPDVVKYADLQMLAAEKHHLKRDYSDWAVLDGISFNEIMHAVDLTPKSPAEAEAWFMSAYHLALGNP